MDFSHSIPDDRHSKEQNSKRSPNICIMVNEDYHLIICPRLTHSITRVR